MNNTKNIFQAELDRDFNAAYSIAESYGYNFEQILGFLCDEWELKDHDIEHSSAVALISQDLLADYNVKINNREGL